ncbi:MAG: glutathione S-transferase family protein [Thermoanaerobaculia bacterium]|nr:glutathione S-transferase family protein [Thermoanaerobaculia bacterium]
MTNQPLRLFALGTGWGVPFPTSAPFPLKLATWMRMAGIDFEWEIENNTGKGPKGKSPWIEDGTVRMGDSTLIIEYLREKFDVPDFDRGLTPEQLAVSNAVKRMLEDHYHQCFEHQLFFGAGKDERLAEFADQMPPIIRTLLPKVLANAFKKQLHARGMGRHTEEVIIAQGKEDLDSVANLLGDDDFFHGDTPTEIDACVFGFLGVTVYVEGDNPLYQHAAQNPRLMAYCERMRRRYFPETAAELPFADGAASMQDAA